MGITKAYTTRVGEGPFPTELKDEIGDKLGTRGKEFGTVTSRKRRCGWFDGVLVRQTIKISGINGIALTKLDVLDELDEIKICIGYELKGKKIDYLPAAVEDQLKVKPIYKNFRGWKTSTKGIKSFKDLPKNAQEYIKGLEKLMEEENVKIIKGQEVTKIVSLNSKVKSVRLENGKEINADNVICNADPPAVYETLLDQKKLNPIFKWKKKRMEYLS